MRTMISNLDYEWIVLTNLFAFAPLRSFSEHAQEIIAKKKAQLDKDAQQYPLGLRKQYEQQLRFFEDDVPVIEFLNVAASITPVPDPSKPHLMVVATLVHPWSRGTIVRLPCLIQ